MKTLGIVILVAALIYFLVPGAAFFVATWFEGSALSRIGTTEKPAVKHS